MKLHEYQVKSLMKEKGLSVPDGILAHTPDEMIKAAHALGGNKWVAKVQVHAGGRGKAGGVRLMDSEEEMRAFGQKFIASHFTTKQTDTKGCLINSIWVEAPISIEKELYFSVVIDRLTAKIMIIASADGGMDIEEIAKESPERIHNFLIDPLVGPMSFQAYNCAMALGLKKENMASFMDFFEKIIAFFKENRCQMLEINPLVIKSDGEMICLDAKAEIDDNYLPFNSELAAFEDPTQTDYREYQAKEVGLNYIALEGNVGCMVNGAGLAMATMDAIKLAGGEPANFLDVGGTVTESRIVKAFEIFSSDDQIECILINIFGGIVRCDLIADGLIEALKTVEIKMPIVVVRLQGNRSQEAFEKLQTIQGAQVFPEFDFQKAVDKTVAFSTKN